MEHALMPTFLGLPWHPTLGSEAPGPAQMWNLGRPPRTTPCGPMHGQWGPFEADLDKS